jgi:hypothetical protein
MGNVALRLLRRPWKQLRQRLRVQLAKIIDATQHEPIGMHPMAWRLDAHEPLEFMEVLCDGHSRQIARILNDLHDSSVRLAGMKTHPEQFPSKQKAAVPARCSIPAGRHECGRLYRYNTPRTLGADGYPAMDDRIRQAREKRDKRISFGADPTIAGWQCFLEEMLLKMEHYLIPGSLITFQRLQAQEKAVFRNIHGNIVLPPHVCAIFIPPSVLQTMILPDTGSRDTADWSMASHRPMDAGIVLAVACREYDTIINSLLAFPPYAAGVDVYEKGELTAGYSFQTIEECQADLQKIIWTYLHRREDGSGVRQNKPG